MVHKQAIVVLAVIWILTVGATWDYLIYIIDTPTVKFSWDQVPSATSYNWRLVWIDPSNEFIQLTGTIGAPPVEIPRPRSGHFRLEVQACNIGGCSLWALSTTHGAPKNWLLWWKQPAPTGLGAE